MKTKDILSSISKDLKKLGNKIIYYGFEESIEPDTSCIYINFSCKNEKDFYEVVDELTIFEDYDGYWGDYKDEDLIHRNVGKIFIPETVFNKNASVYEEVSYKVFKYMIKTHFLSYIQESDGNYLEDKEFPGGGFLSFGFIVDQSKSHENLDFMIKDINDHKTKQSTALISYIEEINKVEKAIIKRG